VGGTVGDCWLSLAKTAPASWPGPLSMPSWIGRRRKSVSRASIFRRRRQSRKPSRTTSLTLP
jgi:hypothetical protein